MKKLGMGVLCSGRYWSNPGPSRYRDSATFTTLVHVQFRPRAEGNSSSTFFLSCHTKHSGRIYGARAWKERRKGGNDEVGGGRAAMFQGKNIDKIFFVSIYVTPRMNTTELTNTIVALCGGPRMASLARRRIVLTYMIHDSNASDVAGTNRHHMINTKFQISFVHRMNSRQMHYFKGSFVHRDEYSSHTSCSMLHPFVRR